MSEFGVSGLGFRVLGCVFRVSGLEFGVVRLWECRFGGLGCGVWIIVGFGFGVWGCEVVVGFEL